MPRHHTGPAMTAANMRSLGVRRLSVSCWTCHHSAVLDIEHIGGDIELTVFDGDRMVCTQCGMIGTADVRPNWSEAPTRESLTGSQYLENSPHAVPPRSKPQG